MSKNHFLRKFDELLLSYQIIKLFKCLQLLLLLLRVAIYLRKSGSLLNGFISVHVKRLSKFHSLLHDTSSVVYAII